jgi:integrase
MQSRRPQSHLFPRRRRIDPGVQSLPLHYRKRGKVWHARGRVRVGTQTVIVGEFSTGAGSRTDAEAIGAAREADIRGDILDGPAGRQRRLTIGDCLEAYLNRPGGVKSYDMARVAEFNEMIGHRSLADSVAGWRIWLAARGSKQKASSVGRWRAVLQAALNHGCAAHDVPAIKLPGVRGSSGEERAIYLPDDQRKRLLACYNPHAACPVLLLAYQGLRTQEALQLEWRWVDFTRQTIHLVAGETKAGKGRTVTMHPRVEELLLRLWSDAGQPIIGRVFKSARGRPYADTRGRGEHQQGGNPLSRAHATACKAAGVTGFRVHDWRHDWATRMVWAGTDLPTLMRIGGWASLRMVQRYATTSPDRMAEAIRRLG